MSNNDDLKVLIEEIRRDKEVLEKKQNLKYNGKTHFMPF